MTRLAILASHPIQYYGPLFRELARWLELEVFFAHVATPQQQAAAGFGTEFDWDVDLLSGYRHRFLKNVSRDPRTDRFGGSDTPEIGALLKAGDFDALLVMGWHLKTFVQGTLAAKRLDIPVIVRGDSQLETPRGGLKRAIKTLTYPHLLRAFDAAAYVGERSRKYYEHYGFPDDRLFFAPHCVDNSWFSERATRAVGEALRRRIGIDQTDRVVLFAGKLVPFKRPIDVIDACALLRDQRLHVVVAGAGELEEGLCSRARELNVPLHALGFQNQTEMPSVYAATDILVLPSTGRETWGLVANEAIACGVPIVVSSAVGCAPDLGFIGHVFPVGDVQGLAHAISRTLDEPPSKQAMVELAESYSLSTAATGIVSAVAAASKGRRSKLT